MKNVLLLLAPAFEDVEAACALDACSWSRYRDGLEPIDVHVAAFGEGATGRFGTAYPADIAVGDACADGYDGLIIPGGFRPDFDVVYCEDVYRLVRAFHAQGKPIATMCVGSIVAARAGVLSGGRATTYAFSRHDNFGMLEECGCAAAHDPVVDCDGIISCAGPRYSEDAMELFLARLLGADQTAQLARYRRGIDR